MKKGEKTESQNKMSGFVAETVQFPIAEREPIPYTPSAFELAINAACEQAVAALDRKTFAITPPPFAANSRRKDRVSPNNTSPSSKLHNTVEMEISAEAESASTQWQNMVHYRSNERLLDGKLESTGVNNPLGRYRENRVNRTENGKPGSFFLS